MSQVHSKKYPSELVNEFKKEYPGWTKLYIELDAGKISSKTLEQLITTLTIQIAPEEVLRKLAGTGCVCQEIMHLAKQCIERKMLFRKWSSFLLDMK